MPARYRDRHGRHHRLFAEVNPDYTRRPDPAELLPVLDRLKAARRPDTQNQSARSGRRRFLSIQFAMFKLRAAKPPERASCGR
jgi:hypothetical protein